MANQSAGSEDELLDQIEGGGLVKPEPSLQEYLEERQDQIEKALSGLNYDVDRFMRTAMTTAKPLKDCTHASVAYCIMMAAQYGFSPGQLGQCWFIPRRNKKNKNKLEANFQIGYQGWVELCYRSGLVSWIDAHSVYREDHFEFDYGTRYISHKPADRDRHDETPTHIWVQAETTHGGRIFRVMRWNDIVEHQKRNAETMKVFNQHPIPMANKLVFGRLKQFLPKSTEMLLATMHDGSSGQGVELGPDMIHQVPEDAVIDVDESETEEVEA